MINYLKSYNFLHALATSLAVAMALLLNYFFSFSHQGWIVLVAFLISQTTRGAPLRQSFIFFITILLALISAQLLLTLPHEVLFNALLPFLFILLSSSVFLYYPLSNTLFYSVIMFGVVLLFAILMPTQQIEVSLQAKLLDGLIGGMIGILFTLLFPIKHTREFGLGLEPLLKALTIFCHEVACHASESWHSENSEKNLDASFRWHDKVDLLHRGADSHYPEWVYEPGFNPGLRSGFRFFLIHLEQLTEICFSMEYWLTRKIPILHQDLSTAMSDAMQKNAELLEILTHYCTTHTYQPIQSDLTSDINGLEEMLKTVVPTSIELLELSSDYVNLTAWVRDIKDMRQILLQLLMALPTK